MEVSARRIAAQRPAFATELLPCRQGQGMLEERADGIDGHLSRRYRACGVQGREWRRGVFLRERQPEQRRICVASERVRLCGPIEVTQGAGVLAEMVFRGLMVGDGDVDGFHAVKYARAIGGIPARRRSYVLFEQIGVGARAHKDDGALARLVEPVCKQEVATDVALAMALPVAA